MRKLYLLLALLIGISIGAGAQACQSDSGSVISVQITVGTDSLSSFTPSADSLACMVTGAYVTDTIYFTAPGVLNGGIKVTTFTIDSIGNLPSGLCWASNTAGNTFGGGQNGAIFIGGVPGGYAGQYKLRILISATTDVTTITDANFETLTGLRYYLKLNCPGYSGPCPLIDTLGGRDSLFIPYAEVCDVGIRQVSNVTDLSIAPDPFTSMAAVSFHSGIESDVIIEMLDLSGGVVYNKEMIAVPGDNELLIERNGLSAGVYILYLSDGHSSATRRVVIE